MGWVRLHLPRFFMPLRSCVDVGAVYLVSIDGVGAVQSRGVFSAPGFSVHAERRATSDSRLPLWKKGGRVEG